jgi:hypothetical protein
MNARLTTALLNVLSYFPCQEAREIASTALAEKRAREEDLRRVLVLINREGWRNEQATAMLRAEVGKTMAKRKKPVARRVKRREA